MEDPEIKEILRKFNKLHYSSGPIYQRQKRLSALNCINDNELEAIYHLMESHVPSLRLKTVLRYEKISTDSENGPASLSKDHVAWSCTNQDISINIKSMMKKIQEMPPEWTIVQLTPCFNPDEGPEVNPKKRFTNDLYISVFNCGVENDVPFCVEVEAPRDSISGEYIEIAKEMWSIIEDNKATLTSTKTLNVFKNAQDKYQYFSKRTAIDSRLKALVLDLQNLYFKEWRCLLTGKFVDEKLEVALREKVRRYLADENHPDTDPKFVRILHCLVKSCNYLTLNELKRAVKAMFPGQNDRNFRLNLVIWIRELHEAQRLGQQKKHPLILIIDDSLDCFPLEMMDILNETPVSRLPSLHLAYALFKEHEDKIVNGCKIIKSPENGTFIVNPDLDLKNMQNRITSFFDYWTPKWKGLAGSKPTENQFEEMLLSGDIFSYNGHGAGIQYYSMQKIQRIRINAVVLLFGCGSTKLTNVGPQTEIFKINVINKKTSPCVVGMLWEVTDLDTDILTTTFLSQLIPNTTNKAHWSSLDITSWKKGENVTFPTDVKRDKASSKTHEPELLRALSASKKSDQLSFYITKAACVARGIPVRI